MNLGNKLVAQLVSYPMGGLWAQFMPRVQILGVSLNPGPFTIKEHVGTFFVSPGHILSVYSGIDYNHGWRRIRICLCGKRNNVQAKPAWLMVDLRRRISSPYNGCCISKPGVSHVREEDLAAVSLNAHRSQINGCWSCRPNLLGYRPAESRDDCS